MRIGDFAAMGLLLAVAACGGTVAAGGGPDGGSEAGTEGGGQGGDGGPGAPCQITMATVPTGGCGPATACAVTVNEPCCSDAPGGPSNSYACSCVGGMWSC